MSDPADRLADLRVHVLRVIREHTGLHEQFALPIAAKIIEAFRDRAGDALVAELRKEYIGERVYVPARDPALPDKVRSEFNGSNRDDLMKKYEISRSTFYAYIRRERSVSPARPGGPSRDEFSF